MTQGQWVEIAAAVIFGGLCGLMLLTGSAAIGVRREDSPIAYWILVCLHAIAALGCMIAFSLGFT